MSYSNKVPVTIYCKIYTDTFSDEMINRKTTGKEVFDFLIKDAFHCIDDNGDVIPGDCNIWYLGCNEKFGYLEYGDNVFSWSFGESSFDRVEQFVSIIYKDGHFTDKQYQTLVNKIQEGRLVDNMYFIKDYLICKRDGHPWIRPENASLFRSEIKSFVSHTHKTIRDAGYQIIN